MFGLQQKISVGVGGLLLLLLASGVVSLLLLTRFSGTVQRVFTENYNSVVYGQSMKDAVDQIAQAMRESQEQHPPPASAATAIHQAIQLFSVNFDHEAHNITVPGEGAAVDRLAGSWRAFALDLQHLGVSDSGFALLGVAASGGSSGVTAAVATTEPATETATKTATDGQLLSDERAVIAAAQRIIDLNLSNILSADGAIEHSALRAKRTMYLLLGASVVLTVAFAVLLTRTVLGPLRILTASAREIERGQLDLVVSATSKDEIGVLADAFNAMAGRLREDRRSEQLKLMRAQRTTQLALDSLPDAVATVTPDGVVDLANHTARSLFRLRTGVVLGDLELPSLVEVYRQALASVKPVHPSGFSSVIPISDGQERFFLPHALPIIGPDGQPAGVTLVLADITGLRRLDEMKSNLLAVVSHELKSPLTSLRMATHLLLDERTGPLTVKQAELVLAARDEANRLQLITEGLLNISRIESGHELMELCPSRPQRLVDQALAALGSSYRDAGVSLRCTIPADLPLVLADPTRLHLVFVNLLNNALRYTPSGGQVEVSAVRLPDAVQFQVADSGVGIATQYRARIFDRFFRVPGQATGGAGLGLAIAKEIVQAHSGRIWLEDRNPPGAVFCFTVPRHDVSTAVPVVPTA